MDTFSGGSFLLVAGGREIRIEEGGLCSTMEGLRILVMKHRDC